MSAGQTGHVMGQMGHVHGTDGTHTRGCPAKIIYVYCFFLSQILILIFQDLRSLLATVSVWIGARTSKLVHLLQTTEIS